MDEYSYFQMFCSASTVTFRCSVPRVHIRLLSDVLFHGYGYFQMFCSTIMVTFRCSAPRLWLLSDVLFRLFGQLGKKESLTYAHDFELTLDIVKVTKGLPHEHKQKWREFEGRTIHIICITYMSINGCNYQ